VKTLQITVTDPVGLHARPAALFVKLCNQFTASIRIRNLTENGSWVNAKSILSLLTAGVKQNDQIQLEADGIDEETAIAKLETLVRSDFAAEV
jgi:phosphotransferase system HPr (HPr) family protein